MRAVSLSPSVEGSDKSEPWCYITLIQPTLLNIQQCDLIITDRRIYHHDSLLIMMTRLELRNNAEI